jgi:hypothetical protein
MRVMKFAAAALVALAVSAPQAAQQTTQIHPGKGGSPHVRSVYKVDGATITLEYGRPSVKGRTIFGPDGIVKPGNVWRMGADEATTLKTDKDLMFGSVHVPAGTYTLFAMPMAGDTPESMAGKLIISKQTGQWGTQYNEKNDLARVDATVAMAAAPVELLTLSIIDTPSGAAFVMEWENVRAEVPFVVH